MLKKLIVSICSLTLSSMILCSPLLCLAQKETQSLSLKYDDRYSFGDSVARIENETVLSHKAFSAKIYVFWLIYLGLIAK